MEIAEKKAFMFYLNWVDVIDELDDQELRRFINNLVKYHQGEEVDLETKTDRLVWHVILPALQINEAKYIKRVEANRENGQFGGAPLGNQNARKEKTTQNNPKQPRQPDNREKIIDKREEVKGNREEITEKSKVEIENRKEINEKSKLEIENWEMSKENKQLVTGNMKIENDFPITKLEISLPVAESGQDDEHLSFFLSELEDLEDINPVLTMKEYTVLMDRMFVEEKKWRSDLLECGNRVFLKIMKHCHFDKEANILIIKSYFKLLLEKQLNSLREREQAT